MSTLDFCITVLVASVGLCSVLLLIAICVVAGRGDREEDRDAEDLLRAQEAYVDRDLSNWGGFGCERRSHNHARHVGARR